MTAARHLHISTCTLQLPDLWLCTTYPKTKSILLGITDQTREFLPMYPSFYLLSQY